jgi:hypothetical protein
MAHLTSMAQQMAKLKARLTDSGGTEDGISGLCSGSCYWPQEQEQPGSWQTTPHRTRIEQSLFMWSSLIFFIVPIIQSG